MICRWNGPGGLVLDAMPAEPRLAGFVNDWQVASLPHAAMVSLPSGATIRAVPAPYLLATKLEAFDGRGRGDFLGSRDFADIVALIDGREELVVEVGAAPADLRDYVSRRLAHHRSDVRFLDGIFGALSPDEASQSRAELLVIPRVAALIDPRDDG